MAVIKRWTGAVWEEVGAGAGIEAALLAVDGGNRVINYLTADQSFATAVLANVTELAVPVAANTVYRVAADVFFSADAAADAKLHWTAPAGATFRWSLGDGVLRAVGDTVTLDGTGFNAVVRVSGLLVVAGTAGTLQLQAAQGTAHATPTKVLLGSYVELWSP
jgi:hypothetical protein